LKYGKILSIIVYPEKVRMPMMILKKAAKHVALALCLVLVLTSLPAAALAVETYTTSEEGIAMIQEFEDFRSMPYEDNGEWYIGYGTLCDPADYPEGIDRETGWELMEVFLREKEEIVNDLLMKNNVSVTQYQFDAMVSMTYNLGTQWIQPGYRFYTYLVNGIEQYSEAEVVNAIATWCHQGTAVMEHLVARRLREAFLFLYGQYENDGPRSYGYINYDPDGGSVENHTVFYPLGQPYGELSVPTRQNSTFKGWFQANGMELTALDTAVERVEVTAKWESGGTTVTKPPVDYSNWVNPYKDVKSGDWFFTYVRELSATGVVSGYPDGTFQAAREVTAGEALKLILLAAGYKDSGNAEGRHWASNYLDQAVTMGCLAEGEIENLDSSISRRTIARVAAVAMGLQPKFGATPFTDVDDGYVLALYGENILNGTVVNGQRFYYPDQGINRAEMCAVVSRINGWKYTTENDPAKSGYIEYGNTRYPVLPTVPAAPYNPDLFVLDGSRMFYNDPAFQTVLGIDVSSYQEDVDWEQVAAAGYEFAFIRIGYRGYGTEGTLNLDSYFQKNLSGAKAAGLKVGAYFFSQSITAAEAVEEALFALQALNGQSLDYPLVYDWETISASGARTKGLSNTVLTDCAIAFCNTVAQSGYTPMIYYNRPVAYTHYQLDRLTAYDVWFAQYASKPSMYYDYRIWQYSDSGSVPGIKGKVDMNIAFVPY